MSWKGLLLLLLLFIHHSVMPKLDPTNDQADAVEDYLTQMPWWTPNSMSNAWVHTPFHPGSHSHPWRR
jgi:hypothetical protein